MIDAALNEIPEGLGRLRTAWRQPKVFGAEKHGFELNPPLSEAAVREFEVTHRMRLPEDYRRFLLDIGNGGAGPFYGVFRLGEMDDGFEYQQWQEGDGFIGVLSEPFPHTAPWNDLTGDPEETEDEEAYEQALEAFDRRYWDPRNVNGAIPLCHEGCALRDWLVITGPEAGHMWHDARADRGGLYPVSIGNAARVSFLEWYLDWLRGAMSRPPSRRV